MIVLKGRKIFGGKTEGEAMVSQESISFYGGVDPDTGKIVEKGHPLEGRSIAQKVLVFPRGKGSTVSSYTIYRLKKNGNAPVAMINKECETIVAVGSIISEIPCVDRIDIEQIKDKSKLIIDADKGEISCS